MPKKPSFSLIDVFTLETPYATDFRRLLHHIVRAGREREVKSVMVTSAVTGEGKSTVCALTAITAARKGFKTLLVDCDIRRAAQHHLFNLPREKGLVEALADGAPLRNFIKKTTLDRLDLVTAGRVTSAPADVFDGPRVADMLAELKFFYDLIFVDIAPLLPVSDPMVLSPDVDGVLLVIKAGETDRDLVRRAVEVLRSTDCRQLGIVMNNMRRALPLYFDYSYYQGDYYNTPRESSRRVSDKSPASNGAVSAADRAPEPTGEASVRRRGGRTT